MRLLLVRHGEIGTNPLKILETTIPGPNLTQLGRQQARSLIQRFKHATVDGIVASTMLRTRQTAEPLATALDLPIQVVPGLEEISSGPRSAGGTSRPDGRAPIMFRTPVSWS